jgi:hypothetical protein
MAKCGLSLYQFHHVDRLSLYPLYFYIATHVVLCYNHPSEGRTLPPSFLLELYHKSERSKMTPVPRFHRTQTSTQASNEAAKTEKPLASPPRKLETLTLGCKIGFILVYPRYHIANSDIEGTAKNIVRNALQAILSLVMVAQTAKELTSTNSRYRCKTHTKTIENKTNTGKSISTRTHISTTKSLKV